MKKTLGWTLLSIGSIFVVLQAAGAAEGKPDSETGSWNGPFFFIQMADPQFGYYAAGEAKKRAATQRPGKSGDPVPFKGPYRETDLFTRAIRHANRLQPDFVIICGDLTQHGGRVPEELEALQEVLQLLDASIPLYLVSGNTDVSRAPTQARLDAYRSLYGKDWYAFRHKGTHNIVLNTAVICNAEKINPPLLEQRKWLEEQLQESARHEPRHVFIYQHHPVIKMTLDEHDNYTNFPMEARRDYLDLYVKGKVRAVFAGHLHRNFVTRYESIELITSGPITKPSGNGRSGLRIVKVFRDHIVHEYYPLEEVPEKILLDEEDE